jgi:hypothetical protein
MMYIYFLNSLFMVMLSSVAFLFLEVFSCQS